MAGRKRVRADFRPLEPPGQPKENRVLYEPIEDVIAEAEAGREAVDPDKIDRLEHIDRAIANQVLRNTEAIEDMHHRLNGVAESIDRNTAQVSDLIRERDMLRAKVSGAKWVVVTLGLGTVYFFKDILEFLGIVREYR